jgi:hypothetical protein
MDDGEQQQQPAGQQPAAQDASAFGRFRLPEFWPQAPGIWFARAELQFEIGGVNSERLRFGYTVDTLPYESLCLVADLVEAPPTVQPYTILKERLLMAHQLSPTQKAIKLMNVPDLGDRRPSQLLADLLQDCPPGEQGTAFFRGAFLKRLPSELQVHLAQAETTDLKELAQRADQLWLAHRRPAMLAPVAQADQLEQLGRRHCAPRSQERQLVRRLALASSRKTSRGRLSLSAGTTTSMARMPGSVKTRRSVSLRKTNWPGGGSGLRAARPSWPPRSSSLWSVKETITCGYRGGVFSVAVQVGRTAHGSSNFISQRSAH